MARRKLTEKQRRFVEAFMGQASGNATEAARLAGYAGNDTTLRKVASETLHSPAVAEAIEERRDNDPLVATREELQRYWTSVMRATDTEGNPLRIEWRDRNKASELLGKTQGLFVDRKEIDAKVTAGGSVTIYIPDNGRA